MNIRGKPFTTIWLDEKNPSIVEIIDQRFLPFQLKIERIASLEEMCGAIRDMHVRGAPLIGVAAAFGLYLALLKAPRKYFADALEQAAAKLIATRPTAVNLAKAVQAQILAVHEKNTPEEKIQAALTFARHLRQTEIENCKKIGEHGVRLIEEIARKNKGKPVNILTHCNAGWLACVDYGTATAPLYFAHDRGLAIHVWVDETRPRNQGARLTAWELGRHGVAHTVITDNEGGHLMQRGLVDLVIVGSDRTTATGDVCNKIGTYLKALAAFDNHIPFYAALPSSSIDFNIRDGVREIPVEARGDDEVKYIEGLYKGKIINILVTPADSLARNDAFDVTPARLVTGLITERGICQANEQGLKQLFSDLVPS